MQKIVAAGDAQEGFAIPDQPMDRATEGWVTREDLARTGERKTGRRGVLVVHHRHEQERMDADGGEAPDQLGEVSRDASHPLHSKGIGVEQNPHVGQSYPGAWSGSSRSRALITTGLIGQSMANAGSSQRTPRAAPGW